MSQALENIFHSVGGGVGQSQSVKQDDLSQEKQSSEIVNMFIKNTTKSIQESQGIPLRSAKTLTINEVVWVIFSLLIQKT